MNKFQCNGERNGAGDLNGRGAGVVGAMSGRAKISLHKGALIALQVS